MIVNIVYKIRITVKPLWAHDNNVYFKLFKLSNEVKQITSQVHYMTSILTTKPWINGAGI